MLLFNSDPLASILDLESAKQRASIENATLTFEKEKTERERKVMAHERELWEEAKDALLPRGAFWDVVWPAWDCLAYGKREYWGALRNIPNDWDATAACMNMPVEIKGVKIRRPDRCESHSNPQTRGYWVVDWDQPDCKPWYRDFEDKVGPNLLTPCSTKYSSLLILKQWCTGYNSGKRRIEAQIVGINDKGGQDWRLLCNSTPLVWNMITYASPAHCEERVGGLFKWFTAGADVCHERKLWGKRYAMWDVPDESCLA